MQRAKDLLDLHEEVKLKHIHGDEAALKLARNEVDNVLLRLGQKRSQWP